MPRELPPKIAFAKLHPNVRKLVDNAKALYHKELYESARLDHKPPAFVVSAPGRVNLIGEHTDYTGGFVLPLAIDFHTVIYGTGHLHTGKGASHSSVRLRVASDSVPKGDGADGVGGAGEGEGEGDVPCGEVVTTVEKREWTGRLEPPADDDPKSWMHYVVGVVMQYMPDIPPEGANLDLALAISTDIPIGGGLSSSASLEVAVALFLECFIHEEYAFSSCNNLEDKSKERALRCQTAENDWARAPCGIMDQLTVTCAKEGEFMMIDCASLEITPVPMKKKGTDEDPVIVIANSRVEHSNADNEYGKRRAECNEAVQVMQQVPLYHVTTLRDATMQDVRTAETKFAEKEDELPPELMKRAKHVVTENQRTRECKTALKLGVWDRVGELMNASHASLRDDYEVSCEEVDCLVELAQSFEGVYGSRITGGGFGGCTVTLVKKSRAEALMEHLKSGYKEKMERECDCFITVPSPGARVAAMDMSVFSTK